MGACNFQYEPTGASSLVEEALLAETALAAGLQSVRVRGEITDTISPAQKVPGQPDPTAWYSGGVAWYYRPQVARNVSIAREPGRETARNVATHEVCHATHPHHNLSHWQCMARWAEPTYPKPMGVLSGNCLDVGRELE